MRHRVWLGLGSNMGDRMANLNRAVEFVLAHPKLTLIQGSQVYETAYVGPGKQDDYLNACLEIRSEVPLLDLLAGFQDLEMSLGRQADGHMKPRPLDVDILLANDREVSVKRLEVPHPRLQERLFVLAPLAEIAGEKIIPNSGETVSSLCAKIKRKSGPAVRLCPEFRLNIVLPPDHSGGIMED
jgi:2-amino-4-hydroxy-6-hydroxymethyldihydropteridine diphosphokinase